MLFEYLGIFRYNRRSCLNVYRNVAGVLRLSSTCSSAAYSHNRRSTGGPLNHRSLRSVIHSRPFSILQRKKWQFGTTRRSLVTESQTRFFRTAVMEDERSKRLRSSIWFLSQYNLITVKWCDSTVNSFCGRTFPAFNERKSATNGTSSALKLSVLITVLN